MAFLRLFTPFSLSYFTIYYLYIYEEVKKIGRHVDSMRHFALYEVKQ